LPGVKNLHKHHLRSLLTSQGRCLGSCAQWHKHLLWRTSQPEHQLWSGDAVWLYPSAPIHR